MPASIAVAVAVGLLLVLPAARPFADPVTNDFERAPDGMPLPPGIVFL